MAKNTIKNPSSVFLNFLHKCINAPFFSTTGGFLQMAKIVEDNLIAAILVWDRGNWISYSEEEMEKLYFSQSSFYKMTPEKHFFRKELVNSLSNDAKFIFELILDTPDEFLECLSSSNGTLKKSKIITFLILAGWKQKRVEKTFREIKRFLGNYYGI